MKGFETVRYSTAKKDIYCYRCKKFHPVDFTVSSYTLQACHPAWRCPDCGTSVKQLYSEVMRMPLSDRNFCAPHRDRKIKTSIGNWYNYKLHTVAHPLLFDIAFISFCVLLFFLSIPVIYVLGILAFPVLIAIVFVFLFFAPWHTGGLF